MREIGKIECGLQMYSKVSQRPYSHHEGKLRYENLCFLWSHGLAVGGKGSPGPLKQPWVCYPHPQLPSSPSGLHQKIPQCWNSPLTGSLLFFVKSAGV